MSPDRSSEGEIEAERRVLRRRLRDGRARAFQSVLIGGLAWIAGHDPMMLIWLAITLTFGALERVFTQRVMAAAGAPPRALAVSQALSSISFSALAVVLLRDPSALRLAEAGFVLFAVALSNAMQTAGSRRSTAILVTPPATMLVLTPLWVGFAGRGLPLEDTVLLALGGVAYTIFIVRLSASLNAEAESARRAGQRAEAASKTKSEFLAVMSHEIRTPLNGVLGMAQAMALEPLPNGQRERLGVIRESGAALLQLLDDLLDLSQVETGRMALDTLDFDLAAVARGAHAGFSADAAQKGLRYVLDIDPGMEGVWRGDGGRVRQILSNLISNGVKFTHAGGVTVRLARSASGARIEVIDSGIGIAADRIGGLFEKFVQGDTSATRAYGGAGLGLAICHEICAAMGGAITVESTPGEGSVFAVELPLRQVERALPAPPPPAVAPHTLRVLAAEDNPVNRMVLKALLGQLDLEPTLVEDGAEAVRAWEAQHWDLILMDVRMPVMDGPTATMTIRAREALTGRPRTPIIAVTANAMAHQVASYRAAGMDDVVAKPLQIGELVQAMIAATVETPIEAPQRRAAS